MVEIARGRRPPSIREESIASTEVRRGNGCRTLWSSPWVLLSDSVWDREHHPSTRVAYLELPAIVINERGTCLKHWRSASAVASPHRITLHNARQEVSISHPHGNRGEAVSIVVDPEWLAQTLGESLRAFRRDPGSAFPVLDLPIDAQSYVGMQRLAAHLRSTPVPEPLSVEETLVDLLPRMLRGLGAATDGDKPTPGAGRLRTRIPEVLAWLNTHHGEPWSLGELAMRFGSSPWRLSRVFREEVGVSLTAYLARVRVWYAVRKILDGESSLLDLALEAGFSSHSYFTTAVRREFGCAPSQLRRRLRRVPGGHGRGAAPR